ncbi:LOW QUALITY PROTEIN: choline/ethanolamine kinase-like [Ruditapes philippinarum]|uniref:LOW QUALITY PROTEIN: choline/ethanolamine kinase-like n=1 Tax=Ruditapes philippinarum TaxID=129788 RepID=UPI00295AED5F|nr:LOW QUALITY PROTEIN: choline/ethanolamine kinase-like [Ruditapes philippinarum]
MFPSRRWKLISILLVKFDKIMVMQKRYLVSPKLLSEVSKILKRLLFTKPRSVKTTLMDDDSISTETQRLGFNMCRDSIGGVWSEISEADFQIKKLSGGLTNYLYICSLPPGVRAPDNQPSSVLLRVYGDIATSSNFVVQNSVIFALLSEKQLGPKLHGMNPTARIEELVPANCLSTKDLHDPTLSKMIAEKLALFHTLDMPLCKEPRFLNDTMDKWLKETKGILMSVHSDQDEHYMRIFRDFNLEQELQTLKEILSRVESPVVFSHNDLQEGNILYNRNCPDREKCLTVIDWEYCSYNYRGYDFGNHFMEWCYNYNVTEYPYFSYTEHFYPTREQQYEFFKAYLKASHCDADDVTLHKMYIEANTFALASHSFALASHFLWGLWSILQNEMSTIQFGFLEYAESRLAGYFAMKKKLGYLT